MIVSVGFTRRAPYEEAAVDDIKVVELMCATVNIERRVGGVMPETDRSVLVPGSGDRDALAEIGVLRQQMRLTADMVEQVAQFPCQPLVRVDVAEVSMRST